jgi:hypothetical protein
LGQGGAGANYLIRQDIIRKIDILLLISELFAIIAFKKNHSKGIPFFRFTRSASATRALCWAHRRQTAPTLERASNEGASDSGLAPQPIENAQFGLGNGAAPSDRTRGRVKVIS